MEVEIRKILTTNADLTFEISINKKVFASSAFGTSRSSFEAEVLSFKEAYLKFKKIKKKLEKEKFSNIYEVDEFLEKNIGRNNLSLAISIAFTKYFAESENLKVYQYISEILKTKIKKPYFLANVVGGLKHGGSNFQEFLFIDKNIFKISKAYKELGIELKKYDNNFNFQRNLESAWYCNLNYEKILEIMNFFNLKIGIDFAASSIYSNKVYNFNGLIIKEEEIFEFVEDLIKKFNLKYVEDPFNENDFENFKKLTKEFKDKVIVCGDDLYSTNLEKLKNYKVTNAAIVKPSQVGLISKTLEFIKELRKNKMFVVVSHRSNETDDNFISHLALGCSAEFIKFGISGERIVKINEIIRLMNNV